MQPEKEKKNGAIYVTLPPIAEVEREREKKIKLKTGVVLLLHF